MRVIAMPMDQHGACPGAWIYAWSVDLRLELRSRPERADQRPGASATGSACGAKDSRMAIAINSTAALRGSE